MTISEMAGESLEAERARVAAPLVEVRRGPITESRHRGYVAAVTGDGRLVAALGDIEAVAFMRSSSKPHQALPLVSTGAARRFGFDERELAIACGSHNGEPVHTETVLSMLRKTGLGPEALKCGAHEPYSDEAAARLRERGERPGAIHNNCSGKHAGMLALALHLGASVETYDEPGHPVQLAIAQAVEQFSGVAADDIETGKDGCGVPTFALSVRAMALMFARLVAPPAEWEQPTRDASQQLVAAMLAHPEMVEGDGEMDTEIMRRGAGRLVSKVGAEGVYTAGVLPCAEWPRGLGLAFKIDDGDRQERARPPVAIELLRQLGILSAEQLSGLTRFAGSEVKNNRGERVGEVRAAFALKRT